jgi:hypothetical protein
LLILSSHLLRAGDALGLRITSQNGRAFPCLSPYHAFPTTTPIFAFPHPVLALLTRNAQTRQRPGSIPEGPVSGSQGAPSGDRGKSTSPLIAGLCEACFFSHSASPFAPMPGWPEMRPRAVPGNSVSRGNGGSPEKQTLNPQKLGPRESAGPLPRPGVSGEKHGASPGVISGRCAGIGMQSGSQPS